MRIWLLCALLAGCNTFSPLTSGTNNGNNTNNANNTNNRNNTNNQNNTNNLNNVNNTNAQDWVLSGDFIAPVASGTLLPDVALVSVDGGRSLYAGYITDTDRRRPIVDELFRSDASIDENRSRRNLFEDNAWEPTNIALRTLGRGPDEVVAFTVAGPTADGGVVFLGIVGEDSLPLLDNMQTVYGVGGGISGRIESTANWWWLDYDAGLRDGTGEIVSVLSGGQSWGEGYAMNAGITTVPQTTTYSRDTSGNLALFAGTGDAVYVWNTDQPEVNRMAGDPASPPFNLPPPFDTDTTANLPQLVYLDPNYAYLGRGLGNELEVHTIDEGGDPVGGLSTLSGYTNAFALQALDAFELNGEIVLAGAENGSVDFILVSADQNTYAVTRCWTVDSTLSNPLEIQVTAIPALGGDDIVAIAAVVSATDVQLVGTLLRENDTCN